MNYNWREIIDVAAQRPKSSYKFGDVWLGVESTTRSFVLTGRNGQTWQATVADPSQWRTSVERVIARVVAAHMTGSGFPLGMRPVPTEPGERLQVNAETAQVVEMLAYLSTPGAFATPLVSLLDIGIPKLTNKMRRPLRQLICSRVVVAEAAASKVLKCLQPSKKRGPKPRTKSP